MLCGNESADGATSHVPPQLGEWLELPHIANLLSIETDGSKAKVRKKMSDGFIDYEVTLPACFSVARGANRPRLISAMGVIKSKNKPLTVYTREDLPLKDEYLGLAGSPTQAGQLLSPDMSRKADLLEGSPEELAAQIFAVLRRAGVAGKD